MPSPYDYTKFTKYIDKSIPGISYGFNDPTTWMDTGCFLLNYLISDRFDRGIPLEGKFTMFAGDSGSGKSYIAVANIIRWCQGHGVWPVLIDTENALDRSWMTALGVDTSEAGMHKVLATTVDDVSKLMGHLIEMYREEYGATPYAEQPKMLILIDSLGMLITPNADKQFMEGDQKGDLGLKAKQITAMMRVMMGRIAMHPIGLLATNHVFAAQDKWSPDTIAGGKMLEYASTIVVQMNKFLLKEDENRNKLPDGEVSGIRASAVVRKSRFAKPFERVRIDIPYTTGMDPYSGLFDMFEKKGVVVKSGSRYSYTSPVTQEVLLDWRKNFRKNGWLDRIMAEWSHWEAAAPKNGFGEDGQEAEVGDE